MLQSVQSIKKTNLYEIVADEIEKMILANSIEIGEKLPSEQQLAEMFSVSRTVIREAFKVLKERGLLEIKNGEGAYAVSPSADNLAQMMNRIVSMNKKEVSEIYELRNALELAAVSSISNETAETLADFLDGIVSKMEKETSPEKWGALDVEFHKEIVRAMNNTLIMSIYQPIMEALRDIIIVNFTVQKAREEGLRAHKNIVKTIREKNIGEAEKIMESHVYASNKDMENIVGK